MTTVEALKASIRAEVKAPFLTSINGLPCAWEDTLKHMPQGIVCYATNEADWLHVCPDVAIITKYRHDYSTDKYVGIDGSTYNYAEPCFPCESTLDLKVSWATAPRPVEVMDFGTVNEDRRVRELDTVTTILANSKE